MNTPSSVVRPLCLYLLMVAFPQTASAQQAPTAQSFEGVWNITKVVTAGVPNSSPQPSLQIFSRGYYSIIRDNSPDARKASPMPTNPNKLTDAEKIARYEEWAPFGASGGTYEVQGNRLITHAIVAKMVRGATLTEEAIITFEGPDRFVLAPVPGSPNSNRQTTYSRVR